MALVVRSRLIVRTMLYVVLAVLCILASVQALAIPLSEVSRDASLQDSLDVTNQHTLRADTEVKDQVVDSVGDKDLHGISGVSLDDVSDEAALQDFVQANDNVVRDPELSVSKELTLAKALQQDNVVDQKKLWETAIKDKVSDTNSLQGSREVDAFLNIGHRIQVQPESEARPPREPSPSEDQHLDLMGTNLALAQESYTEGLVPKGQAYDQTSLTQDGEKDEDGEVGDNSETAYPSPSAQPSAENPARAFRPLDWLQAGRSITSAAQSGQPDRNSRPVLDDVTTDMKAGDDVHGDVKRGDRMMKIPGFPPMRVIEIDKPLYLNHTEQGPLFQPVQIPDKFEDYDINKDGVISLAETRYVTGAVEGAQQAFKEADLDGDGWLARQEFAVSGWGQPVMRADP